jgi:hypothetical protein
MPLLSFPKQEPDATPSATKMLRMTAYKPDSRIINLPGQHRCEHDYCGLSVWQARSAQQNFFFESKLNRNGVQRTTVKVGVDSETLN